MKMNQPESPRARLQALLAVPEKERTEEQWDEIVELEITLAPGNREGMPEQNHPRHAGVKPAEHRMPGGGGPGKKPGGKKKFHRRPPKKGPRQ
jgi:hypothetical protein